MARSTQDARAVIAKQTEIDFGTTPVASMSFVISDELVFPDSRIIASIAYEAPDDKDLDETEIDPIILICAPGLQQFTIHAKALEGYVADKFRVNYFIG